MKVSGEDYQLLKVAHELMVRTARLSARLKGEKVGRLWSEKDEDGLENDKAVISQDGKEASKLAAAGQDESSRKVEDLKIRLSDLFSRLKQLAERLESASAGGMIAERTEINYQRTETVLEIKYQVNTPVEGLVVRNENIAETDRYLFEFQNGYTLKILDKWTNRSTTIWGDPHVDVDDIEGNLDGDFKDLKASDRYTTFKLLDGTRLTITALDSGVIEEVDILKGSQHLHGTGGASPQWIEGKHQLWDSEVKNDAAAAASSLPLGDVVIAGGDGNDWYDESGRLIWGKTTAPAVNTRPYATMEISYRRTVEQVSIIQQINHQA